jgi:hypothetical protein
MLFDIHVLGKAGAVFNMRPPARRGIMSLRLGETHGDIVFFLDTFHGSGPEIQALLKATKGQALIIFIKSVRPAKQPAGGKRPTLFIIAPVDKRLSGEIFSSTVIVDNRGGTLCADVLIIFGDVVLLPR